MSVKVTGVSQVNSNLRKAIEQLKYSAEAAMQEIAELLEGYAKEHHPWQNQSHDTEDTTKAEVAQVSNDLIRVVLTTGTEYSKFLELLREGKHAWLWPTLLACEEPIKAILVKHLGAGRVKNFQIKRGANSL